MSVERRKCVYDVMGTCLHYLWNWLFDLNVIAGSFSVSSMYWWNKCTDNSDNFFFVVFFSTHWKMFSWKFPLRTHLISIILKSFVIWYKWRLYKQWKILLWRKTFCWIILMISWIGYFNIDGTGLRKVDFSPVYVAAVSLNSPVCPFYLISIFWKNSKKDSTFMFRCLVDRMSGQKYRNGIFMHSGDAGVIVEFRISHSSALTGKMNKTSE